MFTTLDQLTDQLISWGVLSPDARPARELLAAQLQAALSSRILLEQAKGALAERTGLQINEAFELLLEYLRDESIAPDEVATRIIAGSVENAQP